MCWSQAQSPLPVVTPPAVAKAVEWVVLEDVLVEVLVPHRIGDHYVRGQMMRPAASLNLGLMMVSPRSMLDLHIVDDGVHVGDGVAVSLQLLPVEPEGNAAGGVGLPSDQLEFDEQSRRTAGVIVARLAGPGAHDVGHQEADLCGGEELARALTRTFGEFA